MQLDTELTQRQAEILAYIEEFHVAKGLPPTRAEIAAHFGFRSANAAETHLRALAKKGAIALTPGSSRGIRIIARDVSHMVDDDEAVSCASLPLVGRVAAGSPILAAQHIEDRIAVGPDLFRPRADYLLRVHGMSMRDAGILNGDLLAVHRSCEAHEGQIVVARIGEEVTVKRFERAGNKVRLLPENPDFMAIEVDLEYEALVIEGCAVGVLRRGL